MKKLLKPLRFNQYNQTKSKVVNYERVSTNNKILHVSSHVNILGNYYNDVQFYCILKLASTYEKI